MPNNRIGIAVVRDPIEALRDSVCSIRKVSDERIGDGPQWLCQLLSALLASDDRFHHSILFKGLVILRGDTAKTTLNVLHLAGRMASRPGHCVPLQWRFENCHISKNNQLRGDYSRLSIRCDMQQFSETLRHQTKSRMNSNRNDGPKLPRRFLAASWQDSLESTSA